MLINKCKKIFENKKEYGIKRLIASHLIEFNNDDDIVNWIIDLVNSDFKNANIEDIIYTDELTLFLMRHTEEINKTIKERTDRCEMILYNFDDFDKNDFLIREKNNMRLVIWFSLKEIVYQIAKELDIDI